MDFFTQQEAAKRTTFRLVVLFILAVASITVAVYGVVAIAVNLSQRGMRDEQGVVMGAPELWNPELFAGVTAATVTLIGGGTAYKVAALSGGGHTVAEMLGGKPIHPETVNPSERRILNVVEEMAIAAGLPVPPVYLLENEAGINAFAAGFSPEDAVIGVTRGAITHLSRDELQGVIGHEFSHILNGDMKLNIRLIGLLHGILLIAITGWMLFRSTQYSTRSSRSDDSRGQNVWPLVGLALYVLGYVGVFFARLIKAGVSRQREYLADASSVQFTRNPQGLAGALKKIGALSEGSTVRDAEAEEASHLFFGDARVSYFGLMSTHPPLVERIRRIDPSFDGDFSKVDTTTVEDRADIESTRVVDGAMPRDRLDPLRAVTKIGTIDPTSLAFAAALLESLDPSLRGLVRDPLGAQGLVYAMLIEGDDASLRQTQLAGLQARLPAGIWRTVGKAIGLVDHLAAERRLAVVELASMTLHGLSAAQTADVMENVQLLIDADRVSSPFEVAIQRILLRSLYGRKSEIGLRPNEASPGPAPEREAVSADVAAMTRRLLSALAYAGEDDAVESARAFSAGANRLGWLRGVDQTIESSVPEPGAIREALASLAKAEPARQRSVLEACAATIAADGEITAREGELFRVISSALGAPPSLQSFDLGS